MDVDVRGRVANVKLGKGRCLLPVFEAVMNSIHAIGEAGVADGEIEIRIERNNKQQQLVDDTSVSYPITGFAVIDNGVGFTDHHFRSFCKSDTTEKHAKGGKGVGRFLWLKAFKQAEITSVFRSNGSLMKRAFKFTLSEAGVSPKKPAAEICDDKAARTEVRLSGFIPDYRERCPKTADAIANRIVQHFLELFILQMCPKSMVLVDDVEKTRIDLSRRFSKEMRLDSTKQTFQIRGQKFRINHVRLAAAHAQHHTLNFCAHGRSVRTESLEKLLPYLEQKISDTSSDNQFVYAGCVSGDYLDETVISERTHFDIAEETPDIEFPDEISWPELISATVAKSKGFLAPFVEPSNEKKHERIREYIRTKAPQYRHLLKQCKAELNQLPPNLSDEKLDLELYKIDQKHEVDLKIQYDRLLSSGDGSVRSHNEQRKRFEQFLEDWNEAGMAKLARHVAHRKATLAFLEQRLALREDGRYSLEEAVHEVIFPLKTTSDDVRSDQMNLWILDERLAFHFYLASDKRLDQMDEVVEVKSGDRPDLAIFGYPIAFADNAPVFGSVVIIEFKRPVRDDYSDKADKNPIQQVYSYVNQIRSGKALDRHGRPIIVPATIPFYAYVVCDLMPKLNEQAAYAQLRKTPDELGYFGYNPEIGVYIEIISFAKLINDAKKRNTAFFEKLGLPK